MIPRKFVGRLNFRSVEKWLLQIGIAYDTSPMDSDDNTPDVQIDQHICHATGVQYKRAIVSQ